MQEEQKTLQLAYRLLHENCATIREISARWPETSAINDHFIVLNEALAELLAEIAFIVERGEGNADEYAKRVSDLLSPLADAHQLYFASKPASGV